MNGTVELPDHVKAGCRKIIKSSGLPMAEKSSAVKEYAYSCGYLYDHVARGFVFVGATESVSK